MFHYMDHLPLPLSRAVPRERLNAPRTPSYRLGGGTIEEENMDYSQRAMADDETELGGPASKPSTSTNPPFAI